MLGCQSQCHPQGHAPSCACHSSAALLPVQAALGQALLQPPEERFDGRDSMGLGRLWLSVFGHAQGEMRGTGAICSLFHLSVVPPSPSLQAVLVALRDNVPVCPREASGISLWMSQHYSDASNRAWKALLQLLPIRSAASGVTLSLVALSWGHPSWWHCPAWDNPVVLSFPTLPCLYLCLIFLPVGGQGI